VDPFNPRFRLLFWDNTMWVTSGGLMRPPPPNEPLYFHMLTEIQAAAQR